MLNSKVWLSLQAFSWKDYSAALCGDLLYPVSPKSFEHGSTVKIQYTILAAHRVKYTTQHSWTLTSFPTKKCPRINVELFVPLCDGGFERRALFHHCMLVKKGIHGILRKILIRKRNEWTKNSLRHQHLMLQRREILLNGKHVKREMYILIICKNFGSKLFKHLAWTSLHIHASYHKYNGMVGY